MRIKLFFSIVLLIAVIVLIATNYDASQVLSTVKAFSASALGAVLVALVANAIAATFRFKVIATELGFPLTFRTSMASVAAGGIGGSLFFQIAGKVMGRAFVTARGGVPFSAVITITAYEQFAAAIVSALFALGGALFIFGHVYLQQSQGGVELIKIVVGLFAAATAGALLGYGRKATRIVAPLLTRNFVWRCLAIIGLTLLVSIPIQATYVVAAHALSPRVSITNLVAVSGIVMFAASIPVSFSGWGVRELSAVTALGAVGVPAPAALMAALTTGLGSIFIAIMMAAISLPEFSGKAKRVPPTKAGEHYDYHRALAWTLPIGAAFLVLFQIYVPVRSGLLNVNLADPLAITAGALFTFGSIRMGQLPTWRVPYINLAVALATIVLGVSLMIGASRFGWTTWAVTNRFFGWFVLLAYAATGALVTREAKREGFRTLVLTFTGATAAIAALEVVLVELWALGISVPVMPTAIEGFSLNHNFFAFQLLMALCATLTIVRHTQLRIVLLAALMAGLWFAGSRSGWIAGFAVLLTSLYLWPARIREVAIAFGAAAAAALLIIITSLALTKGVLPHPQVIPSAASTEERLITIVGGIKLFLQHPILGAGLGAFRNQMILANSGIPLVIHSTVLWLLAELGFVGFLIFAVPYVYVVAEEWPRATREPASALLVLCFLAFAVMQGPADMLYQRTFWLLVGAGLALPLTIGSPGNRQLSGETGNRP
jgi:uncharacterized membrane protein YbhN (UPF0104 family)